MNLIEFIINVPGFIASKVEKSQLAEFVVTLYYDLW